jgi:ABC-type multidrug transport system ATPase subunit
MYFSASKLTGGYGGANIIENCSFNVNRGEIVQYLGQMVLENQQP